MYKQYKYRIWEVSYSNFENYFCAEKIAIENGQSYNRHACQSLVRAKEMIEDWKKEDALYTAAKVVFETE